MKERVPNEFVDLAKEVSLQNAASANWLLLAAYDKEWEDRAELNN